MLFRSNLSDWDETAGSRTRMGAWIETGNAYGALRTLASRTRMGAWIETFVATPEITFLLVAPVWVRGLKPSKAALMICASLSHPYGCVD